MKRGFTLIEIVVVLSVIAILLAILIPAIEKNVADAKRARAASDVQTLAQAIIQFRNDVLQWPAKTNTGDPAAVLVGTQPNVDTTRIPPPAGGDPSLNWNRTPAETIYFQLINPGLPTPTVYPYVNPNPHNYPSWNGPYVNEIKLDPWGYAYLVNVAYLEGGSSPDSTRHVWVISGGPDNLMETPFDGSSDPGGDDIAVPLQ